VIGRAALAAAIALLAAPAARADEAATPALVERLDRAAAAVHALAGDFTQRSRVALFRQELLSRGRFAYEKPARLRWEYLAPDPSVLIVDGGHATMASPGEPPRRFDLAGDATLGAVAGQLFLWLGAGSLARAREDYALAAGGSEREPTLSLEPKPGTALAKAFARIELRFDERLLLRAIRLRERSGDEKEIAFTRIERNPRLPPSTFAAP